VTRSCVRSPRPLLVLEFVETAATLRQVGAEHRSGNGNGLAGILRTEFRRRHRIIQDVQRNFPERSILRVLSKMERDPLAA
jgi:hypothetical protein